MNNPQIERPPATIRRWILAITMVLAGFLILWMMRRTSEGTAGAVRRGIPNHNDVEIHRSKPTPGLARSLLSPKSGSPQDDQARELVGQKLKQFIALRRDLLRKVAARKGLEILPEVERFFAALESGDWEEIERQYEPLSRMSGQYGGEEHSPALDPFWEIVLDAYGVAEQVHLWPARQLLDYGNSILESLSPGMMYVGGTDNGRWIPEVLNETSGQEPRVVITQNALADGRYMEFLGDLYGDRLATLNEAEQKRVYDDYKFEARKRLEHDLASPDEPKQVRDGEQLKIVNGELEVGGQTAVMDINARLLKELMARNPGLSVAVQESNPMKETYADAIPQGPLMRLGNPGDERGLSTERAGESVEYWSRISEKVLGDPEATVSETTLNAYAHDASSTANLLASRGFPAEAERAYRLAAQLSPGQARPIGGLVDLLYNSGRQDEARRIQNDFTERFPAKANDLERMSEVVRGLKSSKP